jgi:GeoRSP system PqqD family protein
MIVPKRNPDVVWRIEKKTHEQAWDKARKEEEFEELGVLTLMVKGGIHQLNLVGAEIWSLIDGTRTVEQIAGEVGALFGWEGEETEEAVLDFLQGIAGQGWVILTESPEAS